MPCLVGREEDTALGHRMTFLVGGGMVILTWS